MFSAAPIPPPPQPWENQEYEDNLTDSEHEEETDDECSEYSYGTGGYESEDFIKHPQKPHVAGGYESEDSIKSHRKKQPHRPPEPIPYYRSILQEEEYFSE